MVDKILVINVGDHIGERTRFEIEYAEATEKLIGYLEKTPTCAVDTL